MPQKKKIESLVRETTSRLDQIIRYVEGVGDMTRFQKDAIIWALQRAQEMLAAL